MELLVESPLIIFSTYFAIMSTSRFTGSPGLRDFRFVISVVCGIMATVTSRSFHLCDREADAFNRERAFEDDVARQFWRDLDAQPIVVGAGDFVECDELAGAIDVPLDDVSAEASIGAHGEFEVDQRARFDSGERRAIPGFLGQIGAEGFRRDFDSGEADAADRDAVALLQLLDEVAKRRR